ncbi:hypothetical protein PVAND_010711 [Polypedilum vanderplanki]|uniref:MD-2-related lipid-recognition domain-containing protein n=1 Tax=Polypedilum vanderplanki TaxID=319348 RepID=A0A9J6CGT7_POLVA|nr:hypothetical protein PVAND_010711 [Polypedilum vanderplanki]
MKSLIILLVLATIIVPTTQTYVKSCENGVSKPIKVQISDCQRLPCRIKKNQIVSVNISFNTTQSTKTLQSKVFFKKFSGKFDFSLNFDRPLKAYEQVDYELKMLFQGFYPLNYLKLYVTFIGDNNKLFTCFAVDILVI